MSQRNRLVIAALGLAAALLLAAPAPCRAAGVWEEGIPAVGFVEQVWSWLAGLWPSDASSGTTARWEKEGGSLNPNGQPSAGTAPAPAPTPTGDGGSDPNR
jgi:hypothetical protein